MHAGENKSGGQAAACPRSLLSRGLRGFAKDLFSVQFRVFLLVGGLAAAINFGSRFVFELGMSFIPSVVCAFTIGTVVSFFLNRYVTFRATAGHPARQFLRFCFMSGWVLLIAVGIAWLAMKMYQVLGSPFVNEHDMEILAHLAAIAGATLCNFLHMKYFSFPQREVAPVAAPVQPDA